MKKTITIISAFVFVSITGIYLLAPIGDFDFFWHIATGRWIVEHFRLPSSDPFSYTTPLLFHDRELFILRSYWLSQVIYWLSYNLAGYSGIVFLRFIIAFILFYILYKRIRSETNDKLISIWLLTVTSVFILANYPLDRPQIWSFLFFNILLLILQKRKFHYLIPPLMLLWSNMHGGYILGSVMIMVYLVGNLVNRHILKNEYTINRNLILWGIAGILAGFINPCSYHAVVETLTMPESMKKGIIEYQTSMEKFLTRNNFTMFVYWALLFLATAATVMKLFQKRIESHEIILLIGLGYFSFTEVRFIAFFILWAIPLIGASLIQVKKSLRYALIFMLLLLPLIDFFAFAHYKLLGNIKKFKTGEWVSPYFPETAVRFIKDNDIKGNIYNFYDWGGYLIWRFYPEKRVFIDGRQLYKSIYEESQMIELAMEDPPIDGMPKWKAILKRYDVDYILIPPSYITGSMPPIIPALFYDSDWIPVYISTNSLIFARNREENTRIINKYHISREKALNTLIGLYESIFAKNPWRIEFYLTLGDLYAVAKEFERAKEIYEAGLKISSYNPMLKERLKGIESKIKASKK